MNASNNMNVKLGGTTNMERSLTMELVRVTEAAGVAAGRWMGRGLKNEADDAATTAMRIAFDTIPMHGVVVIGEGEMDEAPMFILVKTWKEMVCVISRSILLKY